MTERRSAKRAKSSLTFGRCRKVPGATLRFRGFDWTELLRVWPESRKVAWPDWRAGQGAPLWKKLSDCAATMGAVPDPDGLEIQAAALMEKATQALLRYDDGPDDDDKAKARWIRQRIDDLLVAYYDSWPHGSGWKAMDRRRVANIRQFVAKVGSWQAHFDGPVFAAISAIEDDTVFLQYVDKLLEHMWT